MRNLTFLTPTVLVIALAASPASAEFEIPQWTIAGGGVIESTGGAFTLSGSIGHWEATEARALSAGPWRLTGGFWGTRLEALGDELFRDRFQTISRSRSFAEPGQVKDPPQI